MIPNYLYLLFLVCVQALHFYFSVVISNSFNFIFETDMLRDSINYSFLNIMLSASPALHQALPIISVITQITQWVKLAVSIVGYYRLHSIILLFSNIYFLL